MRSGWDTTVGLRHYQLGRRATVIGNEAVLTCTYGAGPFANFIRLLYLEFEYHMNGVKVDLAAIPSIIHGIRSQLKAEASLTLIMVTFGSVSCSSHSQIFIH